MAFNRRDLFRFLGIGGGAGLAGGVGFGLGGVKSGQATEDGANASPDSYGGKAVPPDNLGPKALDSLLLPPSFKPPAKGLRKIEFSVVERTHEVSAGTFVQAWTYNGLAPGPIIRATENDELEVTLNNTSAHPHNIHFHGRHVIESDGWQPVAPGKKSVQRFSAAPYGLHPYHCHVPPIWDHIQRGMHGLFIVDPPGGRPPAHEFVLVLGDWRTKAGRLYTWNGIAGFFSRFPIRVPAGERVRLYLLNMVRDDPMASFHLHGETFDVFPSGTCLEPATNTDVVSLGPTERCIVEFTLPRRGRYMFHPHPPGMAEAGAMGWFTAV